MNVIDIIICVCLGISIFLGLKDGAIKQIGSLVGIIAAFILANNFNSEVADTIGIKGEYADVWGYIIILIVTLLATGVISYILRKIISFAGLGIVDRICGMLIALVKCILLLSLISFVINTVCGGNAATKSHTFATSKLYEPTTATSKYIIRVGDDVTNNIINNGN